uniref:LITAF domain-containing protein n=1 Tax=Mola mola TaxID=94237 RepID=A0A3Q3W8G3_MOLML
MDPPSYEEANVLPAAVHPEALNIPPPPSYENSIHSPTTPPPTYGEAVGVAPTQTQTQQVIVTQPQPVPVALPYLTDFPALTCCPHCNQTVTTKVTFKPGAAAWGLCLIVMLLCCGCCLIPFMMPSLREAHHSCPQCKTHLHIYKRQGNVN